MKTTVEPVSYSDYKKKLKKTHIVDEKDFPISAEVYENYLKRLAENAALLEEIQESYNRTTEIRNAIIHGGKSKPRNSLLITFRYPNSVE